MSHEMFLNEAGKVPPTLTPLTTEEGSYLKRMLAESTRQWNERKKAAKAARSKELETKPKAVVAAQPNPVIAKRSLEEIKGQNSRHEAWRQECAELVTLREQASISLAEYNRRLVALDVKYHK
jgi:hypothetical protein